MLKPIEHQECYYSPKQREILLKIFQGKINKNIYLTGGTCLSVFYFGHRTSEDLDIFFNEKVNLLDYVNWFKVIDKVDVVLAESEVFCSYIFSNIKVDFVYDKFSYNEEKNNILIDNSNIYIDTLNNIIINKLCCLVSRFALKDIIDFGMFFLINNYTLSQVYEKAIERDGLMGDVEYVKYTFLKAAEVLKEKTMNKDIGFILSESVNLLSLSNIYKELAFKLDSL
jgi:hypothetical protein